MFYLRKKIGCEWSFLKEDYPQTRQHKYTFKNRKSMKVKLRTDAFLTKLQKNHLLKSLP